MSKRVGGIYISTMSSSGSSSTQPRPHQPPRNPTVAEPTAIPWDHQKPTHYFTTLVFSGKDYYVNCWQTSHPAPQGARRTGGETEAAKEVQQALICLGEITRTDDGEVDIGMERAAILRLSRPVQVSILTLSYFYIYVIVNHCDLSETNRGLLNRLRQSRFCRPLV